MHDTDGMVTFVPLRDWSAKTGALLRQLQKSGMLIVTQNGVPAAYVIKANPENIEADMAALNRLRFTQVTQAMRASAKAAGADKMSLRAINAEITAARSQGRQP
jgi:PHD/YefM family antitoxin component YafN of YafNO toxin-antitoxin module